MGSAYLAVTQVVAVEVAEVVEVAEGVVEVVVEEAVAEVDQTVHSLPLVLHWRVELPSVPAAHWVPEAQVSVRSR